MNRDIRTASLIRGSHPAADRSVTGGGSGIARRGTSSSRHRPGRRSGHFATVLLALLAWAVSSTTGAAADIGELLAAPLAGRFERPDPASMASYVGLIVLGGSHERLREAGRLARAYPHYRIVVSGAGDESYVWELLGSDIGAERVWIESKARNTFENSQLVGAYLAHGKGSRWLLVTSATHMPRALGVFHHAGIDVAPYPVFDGANAESAQREWAALVVYWLLGRTRSIMPPASPR